MNTEGESKLPVWLQSSADPSKVSLTIKGASVFIPAVITLASLFGFTLEADSLSEIINWLAIIGSAAVSLYGAFRKIIINAQKKNNE